MLKTALDVIFLAKHLNSTNFKSTKTLDLEARSMEFQKHLKRCSKSSWIYGVGQNTHLGTDKWKITFYFSLFFSPSLATPRSARPWPHQPCSPYRAMPHHRSRSRQPHHACSDAPRPVASHARLAGPAGPSRARLWLCWLC